MQFWEIHKLNRSVDIVDVLANSSLWAFLVTDVLYIWILNCIFLIVSCVVLCFLSMFICRCAFQIQLFQQESYATIIFDGGIWWKNLLLASNNKTCGIFQCRWIRETKIFLEFCLTVYATDIETSVSDNILLYVQKLCCLVVLFAGIFI